MHAVYVFVFLFFSSTNLQDSFAVRFGKFSPWYVNTQTIRITVMRCITAQTITETLTLSHGLRITGPNATLTFRTNCPNDTIFCCKLDDAEFEICNDTIAVHKYNPLWVDACILRYQSSDILQPSTWRLLCIYQSTSC